MKWLLFIPAILFLSCTEKKNDTYAVGKYLYIDGVDRIHLNKNCLRPGASIEFLDTTLVCPNDEYTYCNKCFVDSTYEHVQALMERNTKRKWFYDQLVEANYDMPSYETYLRNIPRVQIRKQLYDIAVTEGWDVGTYEDFSKMLGYSSNKK